MATDIPGASVYAQAVELAKQRYQTRLADLNKQRQGTMRTAGFSGEIDPTTGLVKNMHTDPYNQYGQYQQLNRAQAMQGQQVEGDNISRGLGHGGGLAAQNLSDARYGWGQQDATFGANFADQLAGFDRMQQDEKYNMDQSLWQAQQLAAQSAIAAGDYGAPDYSGGGTGYDYTGDGTPDPYGAAGLNGLLANLSGVGISPGAVRTAVQQTFAPKKTTVKKRPRGAGGTTYRTM